MVGVGGLFIQVIRPFLEIAGNLGIQIAGREVVGCRIIVESATAIFEAGFPFLAWKELGWLATDGPPR